MTITGIALLLWVGVVAGTLVGQLMLLAHMTRHGGDPGEDDEDDGDLFGEQPPGDDPSADLDSFGMGTSAVVYSPENTDWWLQYRPDDLLDGTKLKTGSADNDPSDSRRE